MKRKPKPAVAVAALSVDFAGGAAPSEIRLFPAGRFCAADGSGRPAEVAEGWLMDAAIAAALVASAEARLSDYSIDYEHQTLHSSKNGQPAPAAGWFKQLEWREGDGLYAVDVRWTERAAALIAAGEYRYLSPLFGYNTTTGAITRICPAALTNNPGLDGLTDLSALSASLNQEEQSMDIAELLEQLRWLLNLPVGSSQEDITAHLQKIVDQLSGGAGTAAASADLLGVLAQKDTEIAALKSAEPDPAKFAPVTAMQELQAQIAGLTTQINGKEVDDLVEVALSDGRLLPAQEAWARGLGAKDVAALRGYLDTAQPIVALGATQTGGNPPAGGGTASLSAEELKVCGQLGISPEAYSKTRDVV